MTTMVRDDRRPYPPPMPEDARVIEGRVERVVFTNRDTGFGVACLGTDDGASVTVAGALGDIEVDDRLRVVGRDENHSRFGPRVVATSCQPVTPKTTEGIRRYLAGPRVKGIGAELAKRMVETFGTATFEILDDDPERLREVPGIGRKRIDELAKTWRQERGKRESLVFLQAHGFGPALAERVVIRLGDEALGQIRRNPYDLVRIVDGVGFRSADKLAQSMGLADDAPARVDGAIHHTLSRALDSGHLALPGAELLDGTNELVEVETRIVRERLRDLVRERQIVIARPEGNTGIDKVYARAAWDNEREAGTRLLKLIVSDATVIQTDEEASDADAETRLPTSSSTPGSGSGPSSGRATVGVSESSSTSPPAPSDIPLPDRRRGTIELSDEQHTAVATVLRSKVSVLTGGPGVGKTTVLATIVDACLATGLKVGLCSPTGRAAKRLADVVRQPATTIHRLLRFDGYRRKFAHGYEHPLPHDLVVVDEASMLDLPLFVRLLRAVPDSGRLLLVGDVDQLPSVGPGRILGDVIESGVVATSRLQRVYRQAAGSEIVQLAHAVLAGDVDALDKTENREVFFIERPDAADGARLVAELVTNRIPRKWGADVAHGTQVLTPMHRGATGTISLNRVIQAARSADGPSVQVGERTFYVGDRVMQVRNDHDRDLSNGDVGKVVQIRPEAQKLLVDFDGEHHAYDSRKLIDLELAWAMTVHKSQGGEYPVIVLPLYTDHHLMLQRQVLYTAVTRAKRRLVVVGTKTAFVRAVLNNRMSVRYGHLADWLQGRRAVEWRPSRPEETA